MTPNTLNVTIVIDTKLIVFQMYSKSSDHFGENECIRLHLTLLFSCAGGVGEGGEEPAKICTYVWHSSTVTIITK